MIPIPARSTIVVALVCFTAGAASGWKVAVWRSDAEKTAGMARLIRQQESIATQDAEVLATTETLTRTIYRDRHHYHTEFAALENAGRVPDCGLDDDGLRLVRAAYGTAADPGQPDVALRAAGTAEGWTAGHDFSLADRSGDRVPTLRGTAGRIGESERGTGTGAE